MQEVFEHLKRLQEIDLQIRDIRNSKVEYPETLHRLETELQQAQQAVEDAQRRLDETTTHKKEQDTRLEEAKEGLESSQQRMETISTNKEYDAIQKEIAAHKKTIDHSEDQRETLSEQIAEAEEEKNRAQQQLDALHETHDPRIKELREKIAAIDAKIAEAQQKRDEITQHIPRRTLSSYNFILGKRKDARVLGYVGERGVCSYCYKILEPQVITEVSKGKKAMKCQSCGSLLVAETSQEHEAPDTQQDDTDS
jgi:hypothetical protein